jgi:hypothetical protein
MGAKRRLAFASAVSMALLVPLAIFGGSGFAKGLSSASAQYEYGKVTVCHKTHSAKNQHVTITIGANAAAKMIASGRATAGPCPASTTKPGNQNPGNSGNHGNSGNNGNGH